MSFELENQVNSIKSKIGEKSPIVVKNILIGSGVEIQCAIIYVNGIASKEFIDRDILKPLMIYAKEDFNDKSNLADYLSKKYITSSNTQVDSNIDAAINSIKRGKTVVLLQNKSEFIIADTSGGEYRAISEPVNEAAVRGTREGFVEKLETNVSILRRRIKDDKLVFENITVGRRSQSDLVLVYIDDVVDKDMLNELRKRITAIDVDGIPLAGYIQQYIEDNAFSFFPQSFSSERPDKIEENILEGRVAVILDGTSTVITVPTLITEFFQAVEDYSQRTVISNFVRIIRFIAVFIIITAPSIFLTMVKFNGELIPIKFIVPIVESRIGIALDPFIEILLMEIIVEFLREGGLRLPSKIGQTLSVVGGIIIGDAALKARVVSPATLLIVGIVTVATFLIPNYDMSLTIRSIRFPMLIIANYFGIFGIAAAWFFLTVHVCSLKSLGVPYFSIHKSDFKDMLIRVPLWMMNERPVAVPNNNKQRQTDFRKIFRGNEDE